ncbi:MAG: WYL domain-containing protein [Clostridia bacterium]|nr:WYL domain-containing protein [Clostridia bacterium]
MSAYATIEGLDSWIMQWGDKMKVEEPKALRDMVVKKAEAMLAAYKKD